VYTVENGVISTEYVTKVAVPYVLKNQHPAVAVLSGPKCGSSGEATVAAFIGRENTKLFGQPTAGFTKGNSDYTLPDGSMLFLSSGIQTDRNGKKYPDRIYPDVAVAESEEDGMDAVLQKAREWLLSVYLVPSRHSKQTVLPSQDS
jgi:C-terminal processing protease CtpA/Prc